MFIKKKTNILFSVFALVVLISSISITPLMAAAPVKLTPYKQLEDSHLYTDELAYFGSYLLNRAIMFYELAVLTGDLSYLQEIEPLFNMTNSYLKIVSGNFNCSADLQGTIQDIANYLADNVRIINSIIASTKPEKVYDTTKINELIAEIDSLNDIVLNTINPTIIPSQIDIMSIGNMSITLRLEQQRLMRAVYTYAVPSSRRLSTLDSINKNAKYYLDFFTSQAEKSIAKIVIGDQKAKRQLILNSTIEFVQKADALVEKISTFDFPNAPALTLNNTFIYNLEMADSFINNEVLGAVFT